MADYKTIRGTATFEYEEKRSRFIATASFADTEEKALAVLNAVRTANRTARHNVYAYVLQNGRTRYSDDGEPQGTAGIPTLDVLEKSGVTDCVVVVTRYFGGVMLGAGGLVRAYSHSASIALQAAGIVTRTLCDRLQVTCDYNFYGKLASLIPEGGGIVEDTVFEENVTVVFRLPQELTGAFNAKLIDAANGRYSAEKIGELFADID